MRRLVLVFLLACSACSEELLEPGRARLDPGHEPDPWSETPVATRALVEKVRESGEREVLVDGPAPVSSFSLGRGGVGSFEVTGFDADDIARVRARSLPVSPAGFAARSLPLFVSRTSSFARPPGELETDQGERPPAAIAAGRYLLLAGGAAGERAALEGYDLGGWRFESFSSLDCPAPPCRIRSLAIVAGSLGLAVGDDWAVWLDLDAGTAGSLTKPEGLGSWADVAGGRTVVAPSGEAYLVGATREGTATSAVVRIDGEGALSLLSLAASRSGAAATWVPGRGLLVVGGGDDVAAGAELMADGAKAFTALAYPPDETRGAALVALDASRALRVGGKDAQQTAAPTVELNLACGAGCQPTATGSPVALDRALGFELGGERFLIVGDDAAGNMGAVRLEKDGLEPRELRDPRRAASALLLPTGHVALAGGRRADGSAPGTLELFIE